jgi:AraC family transcriptional activator of mtrCDE
MDLLSRLLALVSVSGRIDARCNFKAPWAVEKTSVGGYQIPYHVLLSGHAVLEHGDGHREQLVAGDIVVFPGGDAHRIHDGSGMRAKRVFERRRLSIVFGTNDGVGARVDILCGRFLIGPVPKGLLLEHLPRRLVVHSARSSSVGEDCREDENRPEASFVRSRLARLVELMREEAADKAPGSETLVNQLSAALFTLTLRLASEGADVPRGLLALAGQPRLQVAVSAMFEMPEKAWTLDQLAALCNMSKATFVRHFRNAIGYSAKDFLTELRMTIASRTLLSTRLPVAEVGERVGYQSSAGFQRVFRRHVGVTPTRWRLSGGKPGPGSPTYASAASPVGA